MAANHPGASRRCARLRGGTGHAARSTDVAVEMEIGDRHSKTSCHETQAHGGIFPGLVYPLYAFLLFVLFVLLIQFKK